MIIQFQIDLHAQDTSVPAGMFGPSMTKANAVPVMMILIWPETCTLINSIPSIGTPLYQPEGEQTEVDRKKRKLDNKKEKQRRKRKEKKLEMKNRKKKTSDEKREEADMSEEESEDNDEFEVDIH